MKKSFFLLLMTGILFARTGVTQNPVTDSLFRLVSEYPKADTGKVNLYLELAGAWYPLNRDSMKSYNELAFNLSETLSFQPGIMRGLNGKALLMWMNQQHDSALLIYRKSLQLSHKLNNIKFSSGVCNNIGLVYMSMGILDSAEFYNKLTLNLAQSIGDQTRMAKAYSDLSSVAGMKGDWTTAIKYLLEIKQYYEDQNLLFPLMNTYVKLGNQYNNLQSFQKSKQCYLEAKRINDSLQDPRTALQIIHNLGFIYLENKRGFDTALLYLTKAKQMAEDAQAFDVLITAKVNMGIVYFETKRIAEAESCFLSVLQSPVIDRMNYEKAAVLVNLAKIYHASGELEKATNYATEGLAISEAYSFTKFAMNAWNTLAEIKEKQGAYHQAVLYFNKAKLLGDSLWNQEIADRVMSLEFQHELDKKETENQLLQMDNAVKTGIIARQWIVLTGISLVLVLLIILIVVIIRNRNKLSRLNDLLEQKNLQLEEANKTKDRFFSIVAHDLRSPFNALSGLLAELDEHYQEYDEGTKKQILQNLRRSTQNTYNLLNNLLDWAQSQQNKLSSHPVELSPREVTQEVFQVLQTRASLKNLKLTSNIDPSLQVSADPNLLKALLINLINNAIKFTPKNGLIEVTASTEGERFRICIRDTGIGIPAEELQNLFRLDNPFKRPGTENEAGTGLGLIMCKEYLDIMGGSITVESREGEGSTFCITVSGR